MITTPKVQKWALIAALLEGIDLPKARWLSGWNPDLPCDTKPKKGQTSV